LQQLDFKQNYLLTTQDARILQLMQEIIFFCIAQLIKRVTNRKISRICSF